MQMVLPLETYSSVEKARAELMQFVGDMSRMFCLRTSSFGTKFMRVRVRVCANVRMFVPVCLLSLTGLIHGWLVIRAEPHFRHIIKHNTKLVFTCAPPVCTGNTKYKQ